MKKMLLVFPMLLLAGCDITVLNTKSDTGDAQAFLIWLSLGIMLLVLAVVFTLFTVFFWKYRETAANKDELPKDVKGNFKLETTWTVIPLILLTILAVPSIMITYNQSPISTAQQQKTEGTHVYVTAEQFKWTFRYENGKETVNKLVIPAGENLYFHLHSKDVIHSFWIPQLAGKTDVRPTKELVYEIENAEVGTYQGQCAEYCGMMHAKMQFTTEVVPMKEFSEFLKRK
ncbi:cytochrome c oxidase subunit II [Virgibacillus kekensis]|uniref:Cytochrome c oxidase subunit 2 n=1 Tax=Virgibacillus kekensis TaxID=202261 RepID=A0ABV9DIA6_9BACI